MGKIFEGSPKDYAATLGLAKPGRGRMSIEAREAVAKARAEGMTFTKETPKEPAPRAAATKVRVKGAASKVSVKAKDAPTESRPKVDPKAVRAWAKAHGHGVGDRGRIHGSVVDAYLADVKPEDRAEAPKVHAGKDLRVEAPRTNVHTKWEGEVNGKTVTVSDRAGCANCRVSLSHHVCDSPAVAYGTGDLVAVSPV